MAPKRAPKAKAPPKKKAEPPTTLMDLPDVLLRDILNGLNTRDKLRASRVCQDFRRLLVSDADKDSWGGIAIQFGVEGSMTGLMGGSKIKLDPYTPLVTNLCLKSLLEGGRSRRFSVITLDMSFSRRAELPLYLSNLASVAMILRTDHFQGRLRVASLIIHGQRGCNQVIDTLECLSLPLRIGLLSLSEADEPLICVRQLTRLASMKHVKGIDQLELPRVPNLSHSTILSGVADLRKLHVGKRWQWFDGVRSDWDTPGMSLTQIRGLQSLTSLEWLPQVTAGEVSPLSKLTNLRHLALSHCDPDCWPGLSNSLTALSMLSILHLYVWDFTTEEEEEEGILFDSPLSSLGPLQLPRSTSNVALWIRLPAGRRSLTLNVFGAMKHVKDLDLHVTADLNQEFDSDANLKLTLGSSLSGLASLTSLALTAEAPLRDKMAFYMPRAFSCLTRLVDFSVDSRGDNFICYFPRHWKFEGLEVRDGIMQYKHP